MHVRYKSLYISLPSCAKQEREMTKFCAVYRTWTATANFSNFDLELNAAVAYLALSMILEPLVNRRDLDNHEFQW